MRLSCLRWVVATLVAALLGLSTVRTARADDTSACVPIVVAVCPSIALGEFLPSSAGDSAGVVLSASIPQIPTGYVPQIALALPFRGPGRYAVTGELRTYGRIYGGIGGGIGNLDGVGQAGFTFVVLGGVQLVKNISIVGRYYVGVRSGAGNSGFVGIRFGF